MDIKEGMIVKFAPEWCSPGERKYLLVVLEVYPDVERCKVQFLNTSMVFQPVEIVDYKMITYTGFNITDAENIQLDQIINA